MALYKHLGDIMSPRVAQGPAAGYPVIAKENEKFSLTNPTIVYEARPDLATEAYFRLLGAGRYNCVPSVFGGKRPYGVTPSCHLGPVEERAQVAVQAQENAYQAQIALQQQNADAAQESARLAENYLAKQTSAMRSAEAYRDIQQQASDQAAAIVVELAKIAALNAEDEEARRAAAEVAIEAENIRQATEKAKSDAAKANQGFLVAQQM